MQEISKDLSFRSRIEEARVAIERDLQFRNAQGCVGELAEFDKLFDCIRSLSEVVGFALDQGKGIKQRKLSIRVLEKLGDRSVCNALICLLQNESDDIIFCASEALRRLASRGDLEGVLSVLRNSRNAQSRAGAAWILHDHIYSDAARHLRRISLSDNEAFVRIAAINAIIRYPGRQTYETLAECLLDRSVRVQSAATFALFCLAGKPGVEVAIPALKQAIRNMETNAMKSAIVEEAQDALSLIRSSFARRRFVTVVRMSGRQVARSSAGGPGPSHLGTGDRMNE
jgi:HEAT repeat protein